MAEIHIGTSGWYYDEWEAGIYPKKLLKKERLAFYSSLFNTVEINNTFYGIPREETLHSWYEATPADMVFAAKASRDITHENRLLNVAELTNAFLERLDVLYDKLGPVLFQFPSSLGCDFDLLRTFLENLPKNRPYTFEMRNPDWHRAEVYELLTSFNVAFCIYDLKGFQSPLAVTADFVYMRLHGPIETPYIGSYSKAYLTKLANFIRKTHTAKRDVYCYFDNTRDTSAVANAKTLIELVRSDIGEDTPARA
jgi:uncharacterized protein YecE (DUF72 family)